MIKKEQIFIRLGELTIKDNKGENENDETYDDIIRANVINWMRSLDDEICWTTVVEKFSLLYY